MASESADVRFSVPPWPGVTVKTAVVSTLLDNLGYQTSQQEVSVAITYEALRLGDVDVFLAGWLPNQQSIYDKHVERGTLLDIGSNVEGGRIGLAVPRYVAEAGVTSTEDLDADAARFDSRIYSIEVGSGASDILHRELDNDTYGLGDWSLSETSTPGMLSAVEHAIEEQEWVVFHAWTPHWMNVEYDMVYLDDPQGMWGANGGHTEIRTLLNPAFAESHPNARQLLEQLAFTADDQSAMIRGYSHEGRDPEDVAQAWIRQHPERIQEFVDGVTTREGEPAWPVLQHALDFSDA